MSELSGMARDEDWERALRESNRILGRNKLDRELAAVQQPQWPPDTLAEALVGESHGQHWQAGQGGGVHRRAGRGAAGAERAARDQFAVTITRTEPEPGAGAGGPVEARSGYALGYRQWRFWLVDDTGSPSSMGQPRLMPLVKGRPWGPGVIHRATCDRPKGHVGGCVDVRPRTNSDGSITVIAQVSGWNAEACIPNWLLRSVAKPNTLIDLAVKVAISRLEAHLARLPVPQRECTCGVHAYYTLDDAAEQAGGAVFNDPSILIRGVVRAVGRTILCEKGWRAAACQIIALEANPYWDWSPLAALYHCALVPTDLLETVGREYAEVPPEADPRAVKEQRRELIPPMQMVTIQQVQETLDRLPPAARAALIPRPEANHSFFLPSLDVKISYRPFLPLDVAGDREHEVDHGSGD
jgi:hypothetical protein